MTQEHILVADDARGIATAVESLLADSSLRERLGRAALERVDALYSTRAVHKHLNEAYEKVMQGAGSRSR